MGQPLFSAASDLQAHVDDGFDAIDDEEIVMRSLVCLAATAEDSKEIHLPEGYGMQETRWVGEATFSSLADSICESSSGGRARPS
ncbi:hypothetical protein PG988_003363 [Apiospora saccharicola]